MDDNYYRSINPEKLLKRLVRGATKRKRLTLLIVIALLIFLFMLFDNKGLITRLQLEQQKRQLIEQLRTDTLELKRLNERIQALESNNDTIEHIARERYGMVREGETVYQIPNDRPQ
ncbi:MAG: septum formation initiator family protein [Bacteroidetes bacterium]|nr:septum formation initiator family protein [Bacteroidota bacterium]